MDNELNKPMIDILCGISAGEWTMFFMIFCIGLLIWTPIAFYFKKIKDENE